MHENLIKWILKCWILRKLNFHISCKNRNKYINHKFTKIAFTLLQKFVPVITILCKIGHFLLVYFKGNCFLICVHMQNFHIKSGCYIIYKKTIINFLILADGHIYAPCMQRKKNYMT